MEDLKHCLKINLLALKKNNTRITLGLLKVKCKLLVIPVTSVFFFTCIKSHYSQIDLFICIIIIWCLLDNVQGAGETCNMVVLAYFKIQSVSQFFSFI